MSAEAVQLPTLKTNKETELQNNRECDIFKINTVKTTNDGEDLLKGFGWLRQFETSVVLNMRNCNTAGGSRHQGLDLCVFVPVWLLCF